MKNNTTYDVDVWAIRARKGKTATRYQVRWSVNSVEKNETFATKKLAESHRAMLWKAMRDGQPFDKTTGKPVSATRTKTSWLDFASSVVDQVWNDAAPRHRKSTAEGLVTATMALFDSDDYPCDEKDLRRVLMHWAFNTPHRHAYPDGEPGDETIVQWARDHSIDLGELNDAQRIRSILTALSTKLDGTPCAQATFVRKRAALSLVLNHAVEAEIFEASPLKKVRAKRTRSKHRTQQTTVLGLDQARELFDILAEDKPELRAFFALQFYAALRPGEARNIRQENLTLPAAGWGELVFGKSFQDSGTAWTNDGGVGEERGLKHRETSEQRRVPLVPPLVAILRQHLATYPCSASGRLFVSRYGPTRQPGNADRPVPMKSVYSNYHDAWHRLDRIEIIPSSVERRPYALRHACISTWLAAGVPAPQVALWAGNSVAVIMSTYAHAINGAEEHAKQRILVALDRPSTTGSQKT